MGLLHLFLEAPRWEGAAMERSKQMYLSHFRSLGKGLERATADRVISAMLGPDRRARARHTLDPSLHAAATANSTMCCTVSLLRLSVTSMSLAAMHDWQSISDGAAQGHPGCWWTCGTGCGACVTCIAMEKTPNEVVACCAQALPGRQP